MNKTQIVQVLKNYNIKDIAMLSSGVLMAQMIGVFCQPITTRLYGAENLGLLAVLTSVVSMFAPVFTLQYDMCIVSAGDDEDANTLAALSFYVGLLLSILIYAGVIVYNIIVPETFRQVGVWLYSLIFMFVFTIISSVAGKYNNRYKQYELISRIAVISTSVSNFAKLSLGFWGAGFWALILSYFLSMLIGLRVKAKYIIDNYRQIFFKSIHELRTCAVKYKKQPLFSMPGIFIVTFSYSILSLLINHFYGLREVGYYSLSVMMLVLPFNLISENISMVFFRNASEEFNKSGKIRDSFRKYSRLLLIVAVPMFIIIWLIAEPAFALVFGREWLRSGTFVKLLIPLYFIRFITSGLITGLIIIEEQVKKMIIQIFFVLSAVVAWIFTSQMNLPIETFLTIISYSYATVYLAIYLFLLKKA